MSPTGTTIPPLSNLYVPFSPPLRVIQYTVKPIFFNEIAIVLCSTYRVSYRWNSRINVADNHDHQDQLASHRNVHIKNPDCRTQRVEPSSFEGALSGQCHRKSGLFNWVLNLI
jgi:hypothetical protein